MVAGCGAGGRRAVYGGDSGDWINMRDGRDERPVDGSICWEESELQRLVCA